MNVKTYAPLLIFFFCVWMFFSPFFFHRKLPVPSDTLVGMYHPWRDVYADEYPRGIPFKNFLITDPIRQQIPWRKIGIDELKQGRIPWWNPYSFSGAPLLGNIQSGLLYPLNVLFFLFPFPLAWSLLIISQPLLAGIFLYLYLSSKKLDPWACLLASIAWAFSGFSVAWLTWGTIVHTALWLPLILLCIDKAKNIFPWSFIVGMLLSISFFAGHVQIFLYCLFFAFFYALISKRKKIFIVSFVVFLIIGSIQLKELYLVVLQSSRFIEEDLLSKEGWFFPFQHLIQFFIPDFFGNPSTLNYWGTWNYGEFIGYIGILPLVFAFFGIFFVQFQRKILFLSAIFISLAFMLPTPIAKIPYLLKISLWSSLQPTRLLVLVIFSLCVISAYGFHFFLHDKKHNRQLLMIYGMVSVFFCIAILLTWFMSNNSSGDFSNHMRIAFRNTIFPSVIFFFGFFLFIFQKIKIPKLFVVTGFIFLASFDLIRFARKFTPFTEQEYFFPSSQIIQYLQRQDKPFRVISTDERIFPPNVTAYYNIEMPSGYDPLYGKYYEDFIASLHRGNGDLIRPYGFDRIINPLLTKSSIFDLLNVKYVLSYGPIDESNLSFILKEGETYL
ncbi:MAG: YfhO family protein, partial [Patescibacteria group bacterium]|nr:YfhO family protein [Patescibacteria group bacterium]